MLMLRKTKAKERKQTCTRLGLRTSNLALVLIEVVANGPANWTEFCTVKFSESMICDISSTFTNGSVPLDNNGNKPEKEVYLQQNTNIKINTRKTAN